MVELPTVGSLNDKKIPQTGVILIRSAELTILSNFIEDLAVSQRRHCKLKISKIRSYILAC